MPAGILVLRGVPLSELLNLEADLSLSGLSKVSLEFLHVLLDVLGGLSACPLEVVAVPAPLGDPVFQVPERTGDHLPLAVWFLVLLFVDLVPDGFRELPSLFLEVQLGPLFDPVRPGFPRSQAGDRTEAYREEDCWRWVRCCVPPIEEGERHCFSIWASCRWHLTMAVLRSFLFPE